MALLLACSLKVPPNERLDPEHREHSVCHRTWICHGNRRKDGKSGCRCASVEDPAKVRPDILA
ncbi:MAG TPA: hypothetical protein VI542_34270, partial [Candidatus Tectomicrobia bacterium]